MDRLQQLEFLCNSLTAERFVMCSSTQFALQQLPVVYSNFAIIIIVCNYDFNKIHIMHNLEVHLLKLNSAAPLKRV